MITNRDKAVKIVSEICNALNHLPSKEDWKKLVDFTENQINKTDNLKKSNPPNSSPDISSFLGGVIVGVFIVFIIMVAL